MKETVKPQPNPGSMLADYETCDRGETPVSCIPIPAAKQIAGQYYEEAKKMMQAQGNLSFKECLALLVPSKRDGIPFPPQRHRNLVKTLCMYTARAWALYGV